MFPYRTVPRRSDRRRHCVRPAKRTKIKVRTVSKEEEDPNLTERDHSTESEIARYLPSVSSTEGWAYPYRVDVGSGVKPFDRMESTHPPPSKGRTHPNLRIETVSPQGWNYSIRHRATEGNEKKVRPHRGMGRVLDRKRTSWSTGNE